MTQNTAQLVDEIVRQVLARLGDDAKSEPKSPPATPSDAPPPGRPRSTRRDARLVVSSPVVSMADLGARLNGVRRLVVPPGAVVTPSVRDELQQRGIAISHGRPEGPGEPENVEVLLLAVGSRFHPTPLARTLASDGVEVRVQRADCLVSASETASETLSNPNAAVVVVSSHPAAALCLVNRKPAVRAVLGIDAGRVATDVAAVGANAIVLDPNASGPFQLQQMALGFCRTQPADCPEAFREALS